MDMRRKIQKTALTKYLWHKTILPRTLSPRLLSEVGDTAQAQGDKGHAGNGPV